MKLKSIVAAVLVAAASFITHAGGVVNPAPSDSFPNTVTGKFEDIWLFNLDSPSVVAASLTNVEISIFGSPSGGIIDLRAFLNGTKIFGPTATSTSYPFGPGNPFVVATQVKAGGASLPISAIYELKVSGEGITGASASYGGNIVAVSVPLTTPVPEPETYAMLLAGLGAIGFLMNRRKS